MSRCAYCLKGDTQTAFKNREHVVPQSLGVFEPKTLLIEGDLVCDECNNRFSDWETLFVEDTWEGAISKNVIRDRPRGLEQRGKLFSHTTDFPSEQGVFDKYHHYLELNEGKLVSKFVPQISLLDKVSCKKIVHPFSEIAKASGSKKKKLRARYKNRKFEIGIYALHDSQVDEAIAVLHDLEIEYNEKERTSLKEQPTSVNAEIQGTINPPIARVIVKVAFNYLIHAANEEGGTSELFGNEFDALRAFIKGEDRLVTDLLVNISPEPLLMTPEMKPVRYFAHILSFEEEQGSLIAKINFYGIPLIYKVRLGKMPIGWQKENFGSGHLFDPISKEIQQLIRVPHFPKTPPPLTFGLFQKTVDFLE